MDIHDRRLKSPRRTLYEVYLFREIPGATLDVRERSGYEPIERDEWLAAVEKDSDLFATDRDEIHGKEVRGELWKMHSHPKGTPIFFEDGLVFIREDDSATIEKLVALAESLGAKVLGENDEEFFDSGPDAEAEDSPAAGAGHLRKTKVLLDDEYVRRRQALLGLLIGMLFPIYIAFLLLRGENPAELYLLLLPGMGIIFLAGRALIQPKYYLLLEGDSIRVRLANTKSTSEDVTEKSLARRDIDPLELVWFPLEYPKKTIKEFHVRSSKNTWLVFHAGYNQEKAQEKLRQISRSLSLNAEDLSTSQATKDVPKKYQLRPEEKRKK